jgi:hypothetical protein
LKTSCAQVTTGFGVLYALAVAGKVALAVLSDACSMEMNATARDPPRASTCFNPFDFGALCKLAAAAKSDTNETKRVNDCFTKVNLGVN